MRFKTVSGAKGTLNVSRARFLEPKAFVSGISAVVVVV